MKAISIASVVVLVGCGSSAPAAKSGPAPTGSAALPAAPAPLRRAEVVQAVDDGLGVLLSHVEVAPVKKDGAFVGFALVRIDREGALARVGLEPGDVLLGVGGKPIRTPDEAQLAFEQLRTAPAVVLEVERAGARQTVTTPIQP